MIRRVSKKREARQSERDLIVELAHQRDGHRCQAQPRVPSIRCGGRLDPHEIIPRSVWRAGIYELANVISVCRRHHDWIDDNPNDAEAVGLHARSWDRARFEGV